eukprot:gene14917-31672_t
MEFHRSNPELELLETEETYVENIASLIDTFVDPLSKWLQSIKHNNSSRTMGILEIVMDKKNIVDNLFSNIKQIFEFNKIFLYDLRSAAISTDDNSKKSILDTFQKQAPFLRMYIEYISNFENANKLLSELMLDSRFSAFIQCGEYQRQSKGLTLSQFLILPIQRIPRYTLILQQFLKLSKYNNNINQALIQNTIDLTINIAQRINSSIDEKEKREKVLEFQQSFNIILTDPARKFI